MPHFTDILLACIALGMPAYFVCRASRFGVGLGAVSRNFMVGRRFSVFFAQRAV